MEQSPRIAYDPASLFKIQQFAMAEYGPDVGGSVPDQFCLNMGKAIPHSSALRNLVMCGTETAFNRDPHAALERITAAFRFRSALEWDDQYEAYRDLFRMFFRSASNLAAWLSIIPVRIPFQFRTRSRAKAIAQEPGRLLNPEGIEWRHLPSTSLELGFGLGTLPLKGFLFAGHSDARSRDVRLVEVHRRRRVIADRSYSGDDRMFFLAIPDADNPSSCMIPVIDANFDPVMHANTTPSFIMARMEPEPPWSVTHLTVTLTPGDGRTVSIIPGRRPLEMFLRQYDLEHLLLCRATQLTSYAG